MTERATDDRRLAATRLAAVQAVYEQDMVDTDIEGVLSAFAAGRWSSADDEVADELAKLRPGLFETLVRGVAARRSDIDAAVDVALSKGRPGDDVERLLMAIFRVATFELLDRPNVPARAAISAYTGLADAFFEDDAPQLRLLAGVLNGIARALRPAEFSGTAAERAPVE